MIGLMRKLIGFIFGLISPWMLVSPAFAQTPTPTPLPTSAVNICPPDSVFDPLCRIGFTDFGTIVGRIIILILIIAIVISLVFLIYGGIRWILSGGDKTAVESARNHIVAAIVGLVVALLAFFIIRVVLGLLGINILDFELPRIIQ